MPILITIEVSITIISAQVQHCKLVLVQCTLIWTMRSIYWMKAALHLFSFCRLVVVLCEKMQVVLCWRSTVQTKRGYIPREYVLNIESVVVQFMRGR